MYKHNDSNISWEKIDGEVIAIHYQTGCYYSLNGMAAHLWDCLTNGGDLPALQAAAGCQDEVSRQEVAAFVAGLQEHDLLIEDPAGIPSAAMVPAPEYRPPTFENYTDLQQLLLADPLHDVDETGWPALPPGSSDVSA